MKRKIIIGILIIIVIGGIIAYRMYDERTPDVVNRKPDIVTDAASLIAAFNSDTASASKKYVDKVIEVTGTVKSIDTSGAIVLGDSESESAVVCGLDRRHLRDHEQVTKGSVAVIQGRCSGYEKGEEILGVSLGTTIQLAFAGVKIKK
ncbi:MAG: OB-fold protein [Flavisolibacter sp.]|jgi:hypothetical protein